MSYSLPMAVAVTFVHAVLPPLTPKKNGRDRFYRHDLPAGACCWVPGIDGEPAALDYVCPCGCGAVGVLSVRHGYGNFPVSWDGDEKHPTISTLVERNTPCSWRGLLTKGSWREC